MSFYHLGNATYQNSAFNPAWIPDGNVFLGLPALSGIHVHINNKLSYNDIFTKENDQITVDVDKALTKLQKQNLFSFHSNVSILHLGFKLPNGSMVSLFANERVEVDFLYPKEIVDFVWNGNDNYLDQEVKIGQVGVNASHFREIGISLAYPVNKQFDFGLRAKYLIGMINASTPGNFKANLTSGGEFFQLDAELKNAQLRTSGIDIYDGSEGDLASHLVMNGNTGLAIDIGGQYRLNKYYSIAGSLLDIGWINWKEDIMNESLNDTTFTYSGINLDGAGDLRQTVEDSLFSKFETTETNESYKTWLPLRGYGSWIYHYDEKTNLSASIGARMIHGQLKMLYGGGVTREFGRAFTASLSAMKLPQQFFNVGAAFTVNGGPVQLYMAADQVINFSAPDFEAFDFRFGINFRFSGGRQQALSSNSSVTSYGKGKNNKDDGTVPESKGVPMNVFLGKEVKQKGKDGIYAVIKKQKKREIEKKKPRNNRKIQRQSLRGLGRRVPVKQETVIKESLTGRKGRKNNNDE